MKRLHRGGDHPEMQKTENMKRLRRGDHPEMQKKTVDAGASGGGEEGITCGGCGTPVSMELDDDDHHVHMDLQELPEGCIANVVSLTTPQDAYRFSAVSRSFMSSADSDAVWDKFLPPDIPSILSHSSSSEKKLYLTLCENPVLVDDGKMSFTLDKWSGKKCYMISPKDLMIIWGDNPEYWKWISLANSRFEEVAALVVVWWLEIRGKIDTRILSPSTVYKAYLVFMLSERARGFDRDDPLEVKVGLFGEEQTSSKRIVFLGRQNITGRPMEIDETQYPKKRPDGWLEVEIGEFFCPGEEDGGLMEMTCMDVDLHRMKRGLIVQGIEVRPKRAQVILVFHSQISEAFSRLQMCTPQAKDRLSRDVTHILGCIRALPSDKMSESSIPKWGQLDEFLVQRFGSEAG